MVFSENSLYLSLFVILVVSILVYKSEVDKNNPNFPMKSQRECHFETVRRDLCYKVTFNAFAPDKCFPDSLND